MVTKYILQGGVRWYANCGFSHRSFVLSDRNALRYPPRQHVPTVTNHIKPRMKRLIEKIVFATFIINSLLVLAIILLPVWIITIPDFIDKYIFFLKANPYNFYTFINLAIIIHWVYCLWFLFKYDKYSKSIFLLLFLNFLYAPFYYYRVKIK